jgi:hypothetical protein
MSLEELLSSIKPEQPIEFDWDAPEAGQFPPSVQPGAHEFLFKLHDGEDVDNGDNGKIEGGFGKIMIDGGIHLLVLFDCEVFKRDGSTSNINFQRVNSYKHPKVTQSGLQELLRSLALRPDNDAFSIARALQGASGRTRAKGEVAWRFYCKTHELTICTHPRSRKQKSTGQKVKDTAWPKDATGAFVPAVLCPKCDGGVKQYGREEFVRFYGASVNGQ